MILAPHFFEKFSKDNGGEFLARKIYIGLPLRIWRIAKENHFEINISNPIFEFRTTRIEWVYSLEVFLNFPNTDPFLIGTFVEEKDVVPPEFVKYMMTFDIKNDYKNGPWDDMFRKEINQQYEQLNKKLSAPYNEAVKNFEKWANDQNQ